MGHVFVGHMLAHIVLRALIYGLIWKVLSHLTLAEMVALVAIVIGLFWIFGRSARSHSPWA